jgi:hypothetical protein
MGGSAMPKRVALMSSVWLTIMLVSCGGGDLPKNAKNDLLKYVEAENSLISSSLQMTVFDMEIVKSAKATPPKEFIDTYNPKQTYCVSCRYQKETLEKGKPPEKRTQYDDFLVLTMQNGETGIIERLPISTSRLSADKTSSKLPKVFWEERQTWNNLWQESCPYKRLEREHKKK